MIWVFLQTIITAIFEILKLLPTLLSIPTSLPALIQYQIEANFQLSSIEWINKGLYILISITSILVSYFFVKIFNIPGKYMALIGLVAYCIAAWLFSNLLFWIILLILIIALVSYYIYAHVKNY